MAKLEGVKVQKTDKAQFFRKISFQQEKIQKLLQNRVFWPLANIDATDVSFFYLKNGA